MSSSTCLYEYPTNISAGTTVTIRVVITHVGDPGLPQGVRTFRRDGVRSVEIRQSRHNQR
jgi:hypothetical protein